VDRLLVSLSGLEGREEYPKAENATRRNRVNSGQLAGETGLALSGRVCQPPRHEGTKERQSKRVLKAGQREVSGGGMRGVVEANSAYLGVVEIALRMLGRKEGHRGAVNDQRMSHGKIIDKHASPPTPDRVGSPFPLLVLAAALVLRNVASGACPVFPWCLGALVVNKKVLIMQSDSCSSCRTTTQVAFDRIARSR
jgi:hypothetical protein